MERKSSTEYSVVFLGKQKVQVTFKDIFVVGSVLQTGSLVAAVPISNIAELVPSVFFCPQTWFLRRSEHIFPRKTAVFMVINTVTCVTRVTSNRAEVRRLNSEHLTMARTSNMAEQVPFDIFCPEPWFLQRTEHIPLRKTPVFMSIQLRSINNCFKY